MTEREIKMIDALASLTYDEMMSFATGLRDTIESKTSPLLNVAATDVAESLQEVIEGWRQSHAEEQQQAA